VEGKSRRNEHQGSIREDLKGVPQIEKTIKADWDSSGAEGNDSQGESRFLGPGNN